MSSYKDVALELLSKYVNAESTVIGEFSGNFEKSALMLKKEVLKYLAELGENEEYFDKHYRGHYWIFDEFTMPN